MLSQCCPLADRRVQPGTVSAEFCLHQEERGTKSGTVHGFAIVLVILVIIGASAVALAFFLYLLIDPSAYLTDAGRPDVRGLQNAYNSARIPVGVAVAACVAAIATGAGVWVNSRSVAVARLAVFDSRAKEEEVGRRWEGEQRQRQFENAAEQLGSSSPAVRVACVYSLSRLADTWATERAQAVSVLCAYLRMPTTVTDLAERTVYSTISREILLHLTDGFEPSWGDLPIDLAGAFLEDFFHAGPSRESALILDGASLEGFSGFDHLVIDSPVSLNRVVLSGPFRIAARLGLGATVWFQDVTVTGEHVVRLALSQSKEVADHHPGYVRLNLNNTTVRGHLQISLRGQFGEQAIFGTSLTVQSGSITFLMSAGTPVPATIRLPHPRVESRRVIQASRALRSAIDTDAAVRFLSDKDSAELWDPDPDELSNVE